MMNRLKNLDLCCVLTLVSICVLSKMVTAAKFPIGYYMDIPEAKQFDESFHRQAREAILTLPIEPDSSAEQILNQIKRAAKIRAKLQPVYQLLSDIRPRDGEFPCRQETRNLLGSLVAQMRADPEGELNKKLAKFIDFYARYSFGWCVALFERDFYDLENICDANNLDEFFLIGLDLVKRTKNLTGLKRDYEIGSALQEFDPTRDKMNAKKLIKWLKSINSRGNTSSPLNEFIQTECDELNRCYGDELQIINMASFLGLKPSSFGPTVKLNEQNRLCRAWSRRAKVDLSSKTSAKE